MELLDLLEKKDLPSKKKLENCRKLMKVRGPDGFKHKLINHGNNASIILHSRLAIIDPKERSDQPMEDETGVLAFNGMIYNYLEIKKTLRRKIYTSKLNQTQRFCLNY